MSSACIITHVCVSLPDGLNATTFPLLTSVHCVANNLFSFVAHLFDLDGIKKPRYFKIFKPCDHIFSEDNMAAVTANKPEQ